MYLIKKTRLHHNAEPSQEGQLSKAIAHSEKRSKELKHLAEVVANWNEETRNKHQKDLTKKEETQEQIAIKISLFENKSAALISKINKNQLKGNVFNLFAEPLAELKELNDELAELYSQLSIIPHPYYLELIDKIARNKPENICHLPIEAFKYATYPLSTLSREELDIIQAKISKNSEILHNSYFVNNHLKFFPDYIKYLKDTNDIIYSLNLKPSVISNMKNSDFFGLLSANPEVFNALAIRAPKTLTYMTKEELYQFAEHSSGAIGRAILKEPEILLILDNVFFIQNHPKYVFTSHTPKQKVANIIANYIPRFPVLRDYYSKNLMTIPNNSSDDTLSI